MVGKYRAPSSFADPPVPVMEEVPSDLRPPPKRMYVPAASVTEALPCSVIPPQYTPGVRLKLPELVEKFVWLQGPTIGLGR